MSRSLLPRQGNGGGSRSSHSGAGCAAAVVPRKTNISADRLMFIEHSKWPLAQTPACKDADNGETKREIQTSPQAPSQAGAHICPRLECGHFVVASEVEAARTIRAATL